VVDEEDYEKTICSFLHKELVEVHNHGSWQFVSILIIVKAKYIDIKKTPSVD